MASKMDANGPGWCENEGMGEILAAMKSEHARRWRAGRIRVPFIEAGARRLVLIACTRAIADSRSAGQIRH
jgi:hypothetical protein